MNKEKLLNLILISSFVGVLICLYIYYSDVVNAPVICPNDGCAKVASSEYSRFLGIHVSLWGLLYYVGISFLIIFKNNILLSKFFNPLLTLFVTFGVLFTIYLRVVEFFIIKAICIWCWGSVLVIIAILVLFLLYRKKEVIESNNNIKIDENNN